MAEEPLRLGLRLVGDRVGTGEAVAALERWIDDARRSTRARYRMVTAGLEAVQLGSHPDAVADRVRVARA